MVYLFYFRKPFFEFELLMVVVADFLYDPNAEKIFSVKIIFLKNNFAENIF
jgi:hypothetical protein